MSDDNKLRQSYFHMTKSYQRYRTSQSSNNSESEDSDACFWDESPSEAAKRKSPSPKHPTPFDAAYDDDSYASNVSQNSITSDEIKQALRKSMSISKKINKDHEENKISRDTLLWILLTIIFFPIIAGSFTYWLMTRYGEGKRLATKRKISHAIENGNYTPLFLYAPGTSSSIIPSALSSCLGLTEASFEDTENLGSLNVNADFMVASSICKLPTTKIKDTKIKLFILQTNPILRIPLSYMEMKDPTSIFYDSSLNDITFEKYIANSTLIGKVSLSNKLLCRQNNDDGQSEESIERAKELIENGEIGLFHDNYDSFLQFKTAFPSWDFLSSASVDKCMKEEFESVSRHADELHKKHGIEFHPYMDRLKELNTLDMDLYALTVQSNEINLNS